MPNLNVGTLNARKAIFTPGELVDHLSRIPAGSTIFVMSFFNRFIVDPSLTIENNCIRVQGHPNWVSLDLITGFTWI